MRNKQSLALLKAMVSSMAPARDFKAAIMQKAKETGEAKSGLEVRDPLSGKVTLSPHLREAWPHCRGQESFPQ